MAQVRKGYLHRLSDPGFMDARAFGEGRALAVAWMSGSSMAHGRDVAVFGERAQQIAGRMADLALTCVPAPRPIFDVGCGTGYLLGRLAARAPQAEILAGIDAAPAWVS